MSGDNLALYVAAYSDASAAKSDFETLKSAEGDDFKIEGAVVMSRDADGNVDVLSKGTGDTGGGVIKYLGRRDTNHNSDPISGVIMTRDVLSANQIEDVENYLAAKYSITI